MVRSKRLSSVARLMQHREQDAARQLASCSQQLEGQRLRLDELISYKNQHLHSYQSVIEERMSSTTLHDYHHFLNHLELAIGQQRQRIEIADQEYESSKRAWEIHRCKVEAVGKVVSRYQNEEKIAESRREQLETDEHSQYKGFLDRG
ncbi:MAG: flagellar export protein FliJ [Gammaproteobacteria bacterium]|nr:flagellar export protein FliJ [Gammaproteobacteria bacterium]